MVLATMLESVGLRLLLMGVSNVLVSGTCQLIAANQS